MEKEIQVCPLCKGKGTLPTGFYGNPGCSQGDVMQNKFPATCRVCFGKGVIETGKEQNGEPMTMEIKDLMNRAKAAEKQRDEARQDCAVAERNHMIEVECRKAEEARAEKALERAKIQAFVVTEYCPHCDKEQSLLWDAGKDGYEIYCPTCGEKIMLCSVCDEFDTCDWREDSGCKKRKKG